MRFIQGGPLEATRKGSTEEGPCIYCASTKDLTIEHPLPRGLGVFHGLPTLHGYVCRACNGKLSTSELQLCRSGIEAFLRGVMGIDGQKHHQKGSSYHRGSAGAAPVKIGGHLPEEDVEIRWELNPGTSTIHELSQIVIETKEGKRDCVPFEPDISPERLREIIGEERLRDATDVRVFASTDDLVRVAALLRAAFGGGAIKWGPKPGKALATVNIENGLHVRPPFQDRRSHPPPPCHADGRKALSGTAARTGAFPSLETQT